MVFVNGTPRQRKDHPKKEQQHCRNSHWRGQPYKEQTRIKNHRAPQQQRSAMQNGLMGKNRHAPVSPDRSTAVKKKQKEALPGNDGKGKPGLAEADTSAKSPPTPH